MSLKLSADSIHIYVGSVAPVVTAAVPAASCRSPTPSEQHAGGSDTNRGSPRDTAPFTLTWELQAFTPNNQEHTRDRDQRERDQREVAERETWQRTERDSKESRGRDLTEQQRERKMEPGVLLLGWNENLQPHCPLRTGLTSVHGLNAFPLRQENQPEKTNWSDSS